MGTATLVHTDQEIQENVMAELKWDAKLQPNEIGVSVKSGIVTLTGMGGFVLEEVERRGRRSQGRRGQSCGQ